MNLGQVDLFLGVQLVGVAVMVKFVVRSLCTKTAGPESLELRQRLFFLFEHVVFSLAAYYVIIYLPGSGSWYFFPRKCWAYPPSCPSDAFHYFYIAKMGTHIEDVLFRFSNFYVLRLKSEQSSINGTVDSNGSGNAQAANRSDMMMDIHHIATAMLCLLSYFSGYYLVGSLLMLVHDVSDIPLDLLRVFMLLKWDVPMYLSFGATLICWVYFRLWVLGAVILRSIVLHPTTSFIYPCRNGWENADCAGWFYTEMSVYVLLIGALWVLHLLWFGKMLAKGYRLLLLQK